jgi:hypothetical protein
MEKEVGEVLRSALLLLKNEQQKNGSFVSLSSSYPEDFKNGRPRQTTFFTSIILGCLAAGEVSGERAVMQERAARFLLLQKSPGGSFNYWQRNSKDSRLQPYPDDLDDTFCALSALTLQCQEKINGKILAQAGIILTALEKRVGGPYRTWLVPPTAAKVWKDIDCAVNSNVAFFLSLHKITLPNNTLFIEAAIKNKNFTSPYYPSWHAQVYYISRFYRGPQTKNAINFIIKNKRADGGWGNILETALALTSLLNFGAPISVVRPAVDYLVDSVQKEGWQPYGFCLDPAMDGQLQYAGARTLTAAACIEALEKFERQKLEKTLRDTNNIKGSAARMQALQKEFDKKFFILSAKARQAAHDAVCPLMVPEIAELPRLFRECLKRGMEIPENIIFKLCTAGLYGWFAYTVYDEYLDREGNPFLLPAANMALRELTGLYKEILPEQKDYKFFSEILDSQDAANTWEQQYCRVMVSDGVVNLSKKFPSYGNLSMLADRSMGHALGPAACLFFLGFSTESQELKHCVDFFRHYIIAKQLNDDAHDWWKDLEHGCINSVAVKILEKYNKRKIHLVADKAELQNLFWQSTSSEVVRAIFYHTRRARLAAKKLTAVSDLFLFEQLLSKPEQSASMVREERKKTVDFLRVYKKGG